ncbi:MAG: tetratricopeptide repeat protein, partial [Pirellulaceae bacterium]
DYSEAIRIKPDLAESYHSRGFNYGAKGEYDKAIADFTAAIRHNPTNADSYFGRGVAYQSKGDKAKAKADFAKAKELGFKPEEQTQQQRTAPTPLRKTKATGKPIKKATCTFLHLSAVQCKWPQLPR